ncbi:MAG: hypothetical protein IJ165_15590 [Proteobacteria bacterium]|nr:hypothetical protein [Pseudomonadota bacterium]
MTTSSNVQQVMTSDPSIPVVSDPSIRAVKTNSKLIHILLIIFVLFAVIAIAFSVFLLMKQGRENEEAAARLKSAAEEVKRINAQNYRSEAALVNDDDTEGADDHFMFFSLFSTPPGADVYRDGLFLGSTPIEQKKVLKSDEASEFVVVLDGYTIERRTIPMNENFSDAVTLEKKIPLGVAGAGVKRQEEAPAPENGDAVVANRAVLINTAETEEPADNKPKKPSKGSKKDSPQKQPVVDSGIVLPD